MTFRAGQRLVLGVGVALLTAVPLVSFDGGSASPRTVSVGHGTPARYWTPEGGVSDQARAVLSRSGVARAAVRIYQPFETGDTSVYDRVLHEDFVDVPLAPGQGPGREGMKAHVTDDLVSALPDMKVRIEALYVDGNTVTVRSVISGTHEGTFLGVPATHREVSFRAVDIHQLNARRQIVRTDHLEDLFGAYRQIQ